MMIEEKDIDGFSARAKVLHNAFQRTSASPWSLQDIVSELCIQTGHLVQATNSNSLMNEKGRNLSHLGDEAADAFLQVLVLAHLFPMNWRMVLLMAKGMNTVVEDKLLKAIVQGSFQLLESSLRINGKRFPQARHDSYGDEEAFFSKTLSDVAACLLALVGRHEANISAEFSAMEKGAVEFLSGYAEYKEKNSNLALDMSKIDHKIQRKLEQLHKENETKDGVD
jgi:NTP pyrophosphatase (non-canonical NTP hydrolase)